MENEFKKQISPDEIHAIVSESNSIGETIKVLRSAGATQRLSIDGVRLKDPTLIGILITHLEDQLWQIHKVLSNISITEK